MASLNASADLGKNLCKIQCEASTTLTYFTSSFHLSMMAVRFLQTLMFLVSGIVFFFFLDLILIKKYYGQNIKNFIFFKYFFVAVRDSKTLRLTFEY